MQTVGHYEYQTFEPEFGGESVCRITVVNDIVVKVSTKVGTSNYAWEGFPYGLPKVGDTKESALHMMEHYFDDWRDEFRRPIMNMTNFCVVIRSSEGNWEECDNWYCPFGAQSNANNDINIEEE